MSYIEQFQLVKQLNANSASYRDPLHLLPWDKLDLSEYWLPPQALSLCGLAEFDALPEPAKVRLSHYEFIGFIRAGLWLEGMFIQRLSKCLSRATSLPEYTYLLHEIREEAGHSLMFLRLMEQSGIALPRLAGPRPLFADWLGRHAPLDGALFWLAVTIGEEIPDKLNRYLRTRKEAPVNLLIREMCTLHVLDEARHIAYARQRLDTELNKIGTVHKALLAPLVSLLLRQFVRTFYLPSSDLYELAGLTPGRHWRDLAHRNPARREFIHNRIAPTLRLLEAHGYVVSAEI